MEPTREGIQSLQRAKIEQARRMTLEDRFLAGPDLFEFACDVARDGMRMQFPGSDDQAVETILRGRIERARRRERAE
jgi:hypothetical protein